MFKKNILVNKNVFSRLFSNLYSVLIKISSITKNEIFSTDFISFNLADTEQSRNEHSSSVQIQHMLRFIKPKPSLYNSNLILPK